MESSLVLFTQAEDVHFCHEVADAESVMYVDPVASAPAIDKDSFLLFARIPQRHLQQGNLNCIHFKIRDH
jgi:hypothetical protein